MDHNPAVSQSAARADDSSDAETLAGQRELALACFILSAAVSLAILWSNFGPEPREIGAARASVEAHRKVLVQEDRDLVAVQKVLREVEGARDELRRARAAR